MKQSLADYLTELKSKRNTGQVWVKCNDCVYVKHLNRNSVCTHRRGYNFTINPRSKRRCIMYEASDNELKRRTFK